LQPIFTNLRGNNINKGFFGKKKNLNLKNLKYIFGKNWKIIIIMACDFVTACHEKIQSMIP